MSDLFASAQKAIADALAKAAAEAQAALAAKQAAQPVYLQETNPNPKYNLNTFDPEGEKENGATAIIWANTSNTSTPLKEWTTDISFQNKRVIQTRYPLGFNTYDILHDFSMTSYMRNWANWQAATQGGQIKGFYPMTWIGLFNSDKVKLEIVPETDHITIEESTKSPKIQKTPAYIEVNNPLLSGYTGHTGKDATETAKKTRDSGWGGWPQYNTNWGSVPEMNVAFALLPHKTINGYAKTPSMWENNTIMSQRWVIEHICGYDGQGGGDNPHPDNNDFFPTVYLTKNQEIHKRNDAHWDRLITASQILGGYAYGTLPPTELFSSWKNSSPGQFIFERSFTGKTGYGTADMGGSNTDPDFRAGNVFKIVSSKQNSLRVVPMVNWSNYGANNNTRYAWEGCPGFTSNGVSGSRPFTIKGMGTWTVYLHAPDRFYEPRFLSTLSSNEVLELLNSYEFENQFIKNLKNEDFKKNFERAYCFLLDKYNMMMSWICSRRLLSNQILITDTVAFKCRIYMGDVNVSDSKIVSMNPAKLKYILQKTTTNNVQKSVQNVIDNFFSTVKGVCLLKYDEDGIRKPFMYSKMAQATQKKEKADWTGYTMQELCKINLGGVATKPVWIDSTTKAYSGPLIQSIKDSMKAFDDTIHSIYLQNGIRMAETGKTLYGNLENKTATEPSEYAKHVLKQIRFFRQSLPYLDSKDFWVNTFVRIRDNNYEWGNKTNNSISVENRAGIEALYSAVMSETCILEVDNSTPFSDNIPNGFEIVDATTLEPLNCCNLITVLSATDEWPDAWKTLKDTSKQCASHEKLPFDTCLDMGIYGQFWNDHYIRYDSNKRRHYGKKVVISKTVKGFKSQVAFAKKSDGTPVYYHRDIPTQMQQDSVFKLENTSPTIFQVPIGENDSNDGLTAKNCCNWGRGPSGNWCEVDTPGEFAGNNCHDMGIYLNFWNINKGKNVVVSKIQFFKDQKPFAKYQNQDVYFLKEGGMLPIHHFYNLWSKFTEVFKTQAPKKQMPISMTNTTTGDRCRKWMLGNTISNDDVIGVSPNMNIPVFDGSISDLTRKVWLAIGQLCTFNVTADGNPGGGRPAQNTPMPLMFSRFMLDKVWDNGDSIYKKCSLLMGGPSVEPSWFISLKTVASNDPFKDGAPNAIKEAKDNIDRIQTLYCKNDLKPDGRQLKSKVGGVRVPPDSMACACLDRANSDRDWADKWTKIMSIINTTSSNYEPAKSFREFWKWCSLNQPGNNENAFIKPSTDMWDRISSVTCNQYINMNSSNVKEIAIVATQNCQNKLQTTIDTQSKERCEKAPKHGTWDEGNSSCNCDAGYELTSEGDCVKKQEPLPEVDGDDCKLAGKIVKDWKPSGVGLDKKCVQTCPLQGQEHDLNQRCKCGINGWTCPGNLQCKDGVCAGMEYKDTRLLGECPDGWVFLKDSRKQMCFNYTSTQVYEPSCYDNPAKKVKDFSRMSSSDKADWATKCVITWNNAEMDLRMCEIAPTQSRPSILPHPNCESLKEINGFAANVVIPQNNDFKPGFNKTKYLDDTYTSSNNVSLSTCLNNCVDSRRCKGIVYDWGSGLCELKETMDNFQSDESKISYIKLSDAERTTPPSTTPPQTNKSRGTCPDGWKLVKGQTCEDVNGPGCQSNGKTNKIVDFLGLSLAQKLNWAENTCDPPIKWINTNSDLKPGCFAARTGNGEQVCPADNPNSAAPGASSGTQQTSASSSTDIVETVKKYWWVIAVVIVLIIAFVLFSKKKPVRRQRQPQYAAAPQPYAAAPPQYAMPPQFAPPYAMPPPFASQ